MEKNIKQQNNILEDLKTIRNEIMSEIKNRPQFPNIGKKGCLYRIDRIIDKYEVK